MAAAALEDPTPARGTWAVIVAAVAFAVHVPALQAGFVYDDVGYVLENPALRSWGTLPQLVTTSSHHHLGLAGVYRPVTALSWALDLLTWGMADGEPRAWPLHATNLALHALACAALFLFLRRHVAGWLAVWSSLLFATHPVHVEVAAWIAARSESLAMLFSLLALMALSLRTRWLRIGLASLLSLAAYGSKETALLLPAAMAATCALGRWSDRRRPWDACAAATALLPGFLAVRTVLLEAEPPIAYLFQDASLLERGGIALAVIAIYARLLAWPWPLTVEYYWPEGAPDPWLSVAGAAILAGLAALVAVRRTRGVALAGVATILLLSPVLHLNHLAESVAERFLYAPAAPLAFAVARALQPARRRLPALVPTLLGGLVVVWGSLSLLQSTVWRDEVALWTNAVEHAPRSPVAREQLAGAHLRAGRADLAVEHWRVVFRDGTASAATRQNLAIALYRAGRYREALEVLGTETFRPGSQQRQLQQLLQGALEREHGGSSR